MKDGQSFARVSLFYLFITGISIFIFYLINWYGNFLFGGMNVIQGVSSNKVHMNHILHVLSAMVVIVIVAQILGFLFKKIGQPAVIGEVVGGIVLGPSLLGKLFPEFMNTIMPPSTAPFLHIIAQMGIILYMFIVGLELDLRVLKNSGHKTMAISHSSIIVPFLLGALLSLFIYQDLAATGVSFTTFSLFLGVSLSITAFPVLARILSDKNLTKTHLGEVALTCAAIDDVTAWCLLAIIVSLAQADVSGGLSTLVYTVIYIGAIFLILRPLLVKFSSYVEKKKNLSIVELALIFVGVLSSSLVTEVVGIHAIFGAFLFGAVIPHDGYLSHNLSNRLEELVRVLFLPAFFAFTGMKTEIGLLNSWGDWMICGLIILLAIIGKFGGTLIAAKFTGASWKESSALGILMNTRGLVELIVLNIGLELNILSPRLFAMLVIMALVTTFMTGPLLEIVLKKNPSK